MRLFAHRTVIVEKLKESLSSVLPVTVIVFLMTFTFTDLASGTFLSFLVGALFLIVGMALFSLGAELSMTRMGEYVGVKMTRSGKLVTVILLSFAVGVLITVSEPDLSVLAGQVSDAIRPWLLILTVGLGVGVFLVLAMLRILLSIRLPILLFVSYAAVFVLLFFVPKNFIPLSFDAGGVTTGPMTVPFIMALGVGAASIRSDKNAETDAFGLVALSSVGPILAVMILAVIFRPANADWTAEILPAETTTDITRSFFSLLPEKLLEVAIALLPVLLFFLLYQLIAGRLGSKPLLRILIGALYTYAGLVLFLTGASGGFMQTGYEIGRGLAQSSAPYLAVLVGALVGYFTVRAEPAVAVLEKQVEEVTSGSVSRKALGAALSIGVSVSVALSLLRALTGISLLWFLIPCYLLALGLSFVTPPIFTSIAFDSGGVASGPMTAAFLLPLAAGITDGVSGVIMTDAFGVVAMVAVTPLVAIQLLGLVCKFRTAKVAPSLPARREEVIEL